MSSVWRCINLLSMVVLSAVNSAIAADMTIVVKEKRCLFRR